MADEPNAQRAIVPMREQVVDFYGDPIPAGLLTDGTILVPLRPVVEGLGLDWPSQYQRLKRDTVLAEALRSVVVTTMDRGVRPMVALPLKLLPGFLFGLNASRVKAELRERILRYQRECYDVLWNAFKGDIQPAPPPPIDLNPAEQALLLAEAVASLARQHLDLEQRHTTMAEYLRPFVQQTRHALAAHEERIGALELRLSSGATISEAQAAEIAGAVKAVAMRLTAAGDANGFGRVWGDLYRRYQVTSYHNLPATRYEEALTWLRGWFAELDDPAD
jgi:hypothetical protein